MVNFIGRVFSQALKPVAQKVYLEALVIIGFSITFYACALYSPSSTGAAVTKTCLVPTDQSATVIGHWTTYPIPIAFHQGDFSTAEMLAITNAADAWNNFFNASQNHSIIDYGGNSSSPRMSTANDTTQGGSPCNQGIIQTGGFIGAVVIYKLGNWPTSYAPTAIALTSTCHITATPYSTFFMSVMEINYQNFFVQGTGRYPDLTSIVLHEFGHLIGLDHSCEVTPRSGMPNCTDQSINPDYIAASLYPSFGFDASGTGQVKQQLGNDDEQRANCLYSPAPAASGSPTATATPAVSH